MRFLPHVGTYHQVGTSQKLASGIYYNTQPTEIPLGGLAVEDGKVFEFRRLSGATWTAGSLVYNTGTTGNNYVCLSGTGCKAIGVNLVTLATSGAWTWIQKYGKCNVQATTTFGVDGTNKLTQAMFSLGGSGAYNITAAISAAAIGSAGVGGEYMHYIGFALSDCIAATAGPAFIQLL